MKGFPKMIATRFDAEELLKSHPEKMKVFLRACLDERMQWVPVSVLATAEDGITNETHKVVEIEDAVTREKTYTQFELREDHTCKLFRLGFTADEAEETINPLTSNGTPSCLTD